MTIESTRIGRPTQHCERLLERIREFATSGVTALPYAAASEEAVGEAEQGLGFRIPALLKACYLMVGNGGIGPGYGIIGVRGGYASDYGTLVETHEVLKQDREAEGREWPSGLLPFCEWGCNIFSCVDCHDQRHPVSTFEDSAVWSQGYSLDKFFELWMTGANILTSGPSEVQRVEITNKLTDKNVNISVHRPR